MTGAAKETGAAQLAGDGGEEPIVLDLQAAADLLHVHPNTLRSYAVSGLVPGAKIGRFWRFLACDLVAALRSRYPVRARMQPGASTKEASLWHSGNVQKHIMSTSQARTEAELDTRLGRPTERKRRNTTTS
ncbi:putative DNA binding protein, excisionase family [uncultured Sphingopyxis sp.]|uniref:Putative DNA binding protein, excisionase family n=1 Tax=uncultured Sphingopyxis sp. TaxID=310581 RepID=A0A1Y5PYS7_9SPHN|nr:putative DNA binding protein, excisionase family [uncultured Sphingopyxis sp.]